MTDYLAAIYREFQMKLEPLEAELEVKAARRDQILREPIVDEADDRAFLNACKEVRELEEKIENLWNEISEIFEDAWL